MQDYVASGSDPQKLISLMARFPDRHEGLKKAYDATKGTQKDADLQQAVETYNFARAGRIDLASKKLSDRIAADERAGLDVEDDRELLAMLKDPATQKEALALMEMNVALAMGTEKFADAYKAFNPAEKQTPKQREYDWRVTTFGKESADKWLAVEDTKLVPVNAGGRVYNAEDLVGGPAAVAPSSVTEGGGPLSSVVADGGSIISKLFPNARITDTRRDPNSALGKKNPGSYHVRTGGAVDVAPIPGLTFKQYLQSIKQAGYKIVEAKNEVGAGRSKHATGDHWHVVIGEGPGREKPVQKKVGGTTYYQINGKWYDNPEGK